MKASRLKLKLPPLKVVQRSTSGETAHRIVPRGFVSQSEEPGPSNDGKHDNDVGDYYGPDPFLDTESPSMEPSLHKIAQNSAAISWNKIRSNLLKAAIEGNAMPLDQYCSMCSTREAVYRCLRCSPCAYFCRECFENAHSKTNFFHTGEIWEV